MLILTRRVNERIMIGSDVEVSIVDVRGDQVKVGIVAPRSVQVHRREVFDAMLAENRAAAAADATALPDISQLLVRKPDQQDNR